jgi:hypothetical protein
MFCCLYVFLDSQSRKEQAPSNAARKREIAVMAVEVILGDSKAARRFRCAQQFIGLRLSGRGGRQPRHRSTADFLQLPKKAREFTCREFLRGHHDGLKFIPHGDAAMMKISTTLVSVTALRFFRSSHTLDHEIGPERTQILSSRSQFSS